MGDTKKEGSPKRLKEEKFEPNNCKINFFPLHLCRMLINNNGIIMVYCSSSNILSIGIYNLFLTSFWQTSIYCHRAGRQFKSSAQYLLSKEISQNLKEKSTIYYLSQAFHYGNSF